MTEENKPPQTDPPSEQPPAEVEQAPVENADATAARPSRKRRRQSRHLLDVVIPRAFLLGILAALLVVIGVMAVGFAVVTDPNACGTCHVISKEVDSFKASTHNTDGIGCQDCHTKPGVFNYFVYNLVSLTHIYEYVSKNYQQPLVTFVGVANCVECHPKEEIEKDIIVGNIRVNHKGLREGGMQCMTCHSDVVHGDASPVGSRPLSNRMSICGRCHNGVDQPRTCSICHIGGVPEGTVNVTIKAHISSKNCTACHKKAAFCSTKCHNGVTMPHRAGWRGAHGKTVLASSIGARACAKCHQDKKPAFCSNCHGLQMPHVSGWQNTHGARGLNQPALCAKCHGASSCTKCHGLQMPHPPSWQGSHPTVAKSSPALCSKCHAASFCTSCHGLSLPHSSAFIASHFTYVLSQGSVCVKCHGNAGTGASGCFGGDCHSGSAAPN